MGFLRSGEDAHVIKGGGFDVSVNISHTDGFDQFSRVNLSKE